MTNKKMGRQGAAGELNRSVFGEETTFHRLLTGNYS